MAFSALEALQTFGMGRQIAQQERQMARQEALAARQEAGRVRVGQQIQAGDLSGAVSTSIESGLGDDVIQNIGRLDTVQRGKLQQEAAAGLEAARALRQAPMEQRAVLAEQFAPRLRQLGWDQNEMQQLMADLSDGTLDGHISFTQGVLQQVASQGRGGQPYRWRDNGGNLMEIGADGQPRVAYPDPIPRMQWVRDPHTGREGWVTQPNTPEQQGSGPEPGAVEDGYRFRGGNPADPTSWEPVEGGASQSGSQTFPDEWQPTDSSYPPGQW